jgi:hypothetical protein
LDVINLGVSAISGKVGKSGDRRAGEPLGKVNVELLHGEEVGLAGWCPESKFSQPWHSCLR